MSKKLHLTNCKKNYKVKKEMEVKLAKTNIRKQVGSDILSSLLPLARTLALHTWMEAIGLLLMLKITPLIILLVLKRKN